MRSLALSLLLTLVLVPAASAANRGFGGFTYNYSFSTLDLQTYVDENSWYGATIDVRRYLTDSKNLTFGLSTGWYIFYNSVDQVIEVPNGAVSGLQYRNFNILPILAGLHYAVGNPHGLRPYVGLNAGAYYARQEFDIGIYAKTPDNWHFGLAPEAGVLYPVWYETYFYCNARYHYLFPAGGYLAGQALELGFLTLAVGIVWDY